MAIIHANHAFDILDLDLNRLIAGRTDWSFLNNANVTYRGTTYRDGYLTEWRHESNDFASMLTGANLAVSNSGRLTGGVVQSYSEMLWTGARYYEMWGMTGVSINAANLFDAMRTRSTVDDDALIIRTLRGNDRFNLSPDADLANGFAGDDTLSGRGGDDVLAGGHGDDQIYGQTGNDSLFLDAGNDLIAGGRGRDMVLANGGTDVTIRLNVNGRQNTGMGFDTISGVENAAGANGDDRLIGNSGANRLTGNAGNDVLDGRGGNDRLHGGRGEDRLSGGDGRDMMTGGGGADVFVFRATAEIGRSAAASDVISDFQPGLDVISLRHIDASSVLSGNNAFLFRGEGAIGTSNRGEVQVSHLDRPGRANDVTLVRIDTDADRAAEAEIRLTGLHDLSADDFLF